MKVKKVILKKGNVKDFFKSVEKSINEPIKENKSVLYIEDIDVFRKILTGERLKILSIIRHKNPKSVYELAKMLKRDRSNVITDLDILQNLGLVDFKEELCGAREMTRPVANYDNLNLNIEI